jgi:tetratricopeptide (TPR) repeat protein
MAWLHVAVICLDFFTFQLEYEMCGRTNYLRQVVRIQDAAQDLLRLLKGSVIALACIGNHLHNQCGKDPTEWHKTIDGLTRVLEDPDTVLGGYEKNVFAVFDFVFDGLRTPSQKEILLALGCFGAEVAIPFKLVKLAVEVQTGKMYDPHDMSWDLDEIVKANLLEDYVEDGFVHASENMKGYKLLDLVAMWLTWRTQGPGSVLGSNEPSRLLAAFLTSFGQPTRNVPQLAASFLKEQGVVDFDDFADPSLSQEPLVAAKLCNKVGRDLQVEHVIAHVLLRCAVTKRRMSRHEEALQDLDRADALQPNNALTLRARGDTMSMLGRYEEALQDLDRANSREPNDPFTLTVRGDTERMLGKHEEALQDLDRADALQPNNAFTLTSRGETKRSLGKYEEALQDLDRAYALKPNDAFTLKNRGDTKRLMGNYAEALQDLDRANSLEPNDDVTLAVRGVTKRRLGKYEEAMQDLDRADALEPNDTFTLKNRGDTKMMMGRYEEALQDLDKADALEPNDAVTLAVRGETKTRLGRYEEALQDLDRAIALEPNDVVTLVVRGVTKRSLGKYEEALQDLDHADVLQPNNALSSKSTWGDHEYVGHV